MKQYYDIVIYETRKCAVEICVNPKSISSKGATQKNDWHANLMANITIDATTASGIIMSIVYLSIRMTMDLNSFNTGVIKHLSKWNV